MDLGHCVFLPNSLHGNPFGDEGTELLVRELLKINDLALREKQPGEEGTRDLTMSVIRNELLGDDTSSEDAREIEGALDNGQAGFSLRQLDIGDCGMAGEGASAVAALLRAKTPLRSLSITGNKRLMLTGWAEIGAALGRSWWLDTLSLDYNDLGDAGVQFIAEGLWKNTSIKSLDLEGNKIGDKGAEHLVKMLEENKTIRDVTLMPGNDISTEMQQNIARALRENAQQS